MAILDNNNIYHSIILVDLWIYNINGMIILVDNPPDNIIEYAICIQKSIYKSIMVSDWQWYDE